MPDKGSEKAFELLRNAMMNEQHIAIAKTVLGTKDTLLALIPRSEGLLIQTMFYEAEIKELPQTYPKGEVNGAELEMAQKLIESMVKPFDSSQCKDEYQGRLKALISEKIAGKKVTAPRPAQQGNVIDLMEALQQSLKLQHKEPITTGKLQHKEPTAAGSRKKRA